MLDTLRSARLSLRSLRKSWGFSLVAILTLGLGVGANTAIFSVVNGVLLRPLPYTSPDDVATIWHRGLDGTYDQSTTTPANFYAWKEQATRSFDAMAAYATTARTLTGRGDPERVVGVISAGSVFDVLRVTPAVGRTFADAEDGPGADPVIVISHGLWDRLFGLDAGAVGQTLELSGTAYTIIGAMPAGFAFPSSAASYWIPARFSEEFRGSRDQYFLVGLGRLRAGVDEEAALAELETVMGRLRIDDPQANENVAANLIPIEDLIVGPVRTRLRLFMGAVGLVLLIACANLANLFLARAQGRRDEVVLRQALGASRTRIVGQFLTETVGLALAGCLTGIAIGWGLLRVLVALLAQTLPRLDAVSLDLGVLAFAIVVSLAAGVAAGLFPALATSRDRAGDALRGGTRSTDPRGRARQALVVSEVALAMVLLCGAGLLVKSFWTLQNVDPGVTVERTLTFSTSLPGDRYPVEDRVRFVETARERLAAIPGVTGVDVISNLPVTGRNVGAWFNILDRPVAPGETPPAVPYRVVSPDFHRTMGIELVRGRYLSREDRRDGSEAVLVNEEVVRQFFPDEEALDREIYLGAPDNRLFESARIVGIVRDVRTGGLDAAQLPVVYVPHAVMPYWSGFGFVVRTVNEPATVAPGVRAAMYELDSGLPLTDMQSMEQLVAGTITSQRSSMILLAVFASIAFAMALLGVFGVLSYTVGQRMRELGIRVALGASGASVRRMVVGGGVRTILVGVAIGSVAAYGLTRLMSSMLFETSATDPLTFIAVAVGLVAAGALAAYIPARRASRADPIEVLRAE
ncbi:MAG: ABC transporter permease [Gemmatimonadota bacterium]|nr:ABC transporter permease [Gemmatimonadota bacterium]